MFSLDMSSNTLCCFVANWRWQCVVAAADRHLSAEVKEEWQELDELKPEPSSPAEIAQRREKLLEMVYQIVPYLMQHNAEAEACDVLMETERLDLLQQYVERTAFPRVCLYLRRCANNPHDYCCWQKINTPIHCSVLAHFTK